MPDRIVAIIPVIDEEGAIGPTLRRLPPIVDRAIVVDGGSRDGTVAEARGAGATVIEEPRRGYGRACLTGAEHAIAEGADILLFLDGDGADAVEEAGRLVTPLLRNELDFVLADRTGGVREKGAMGPHQIAAGRLIGVAVKLLAGRRYRDMCAFRAIHADDFQRLGMRELGYGWNLEMQMRAARAGLRIREVPLPYYRRVAGASKVAGSLRGSVRAGQRIVRTLVSVGFALRGAPP